jgi:cytochrome c oxidase subunit 4
MADLTKMAPSEITEEHGTESHAPYLKVWAALAVLTAIEYYYAFWFKSVFLILLFGLLFWAIIKAGLVGWYFMHLKFEGKWVFALIVPAFVLATIFVLALMPDMTLKENADDILMEDTSFLVPAPERLGVGGAASYWASATARSPHPPCRAPSPGGRGILVTSLFLRERVGVRVLRENETAFRRGNLVGSLSLRERVGVRVRSLANAGATESSKQ